MRLPLSRAHFRRFVLTSLASAWTWCAVATSADAQTMAGAWSAPLRYPSTPRGAHADEVGGIRVPDPYRWLENLGAPEVHAWVTVQSALADSFFSAVPKRKEIHDAVIRASSRTKVGAPFAAGDRLFYYENIGLDNQPVLYVQERFDALPRVFLDANAFSRDGLIAIVDQAPSPEGRYLAYAVSTQGSSWRVVRVREVRTNQDLGEELTGIKEGPLAWTKDERGFFYVRVEPGAAGTPSGSISIAPDGRQRVFYHRLGRPQSQDHLVYENTDLPSQQLRATVSEDGQYLVITSRTGTELTNRLYFIDLANPKRPNLGAPIVKLFDAGDALYEFVSSVGSVFYLRTTKGAPNGRLVGVDINTPDANYWTTPIRQTSDPLVSVRRVDDRFVAHRLHDAHSVLELYMLDGGVRGTVPLPGVGTVTDLNGRAETREIFFTYSSFLQPSVAYRYDLDARNTTPFRDQRADTSLARYETTQLFFTSKDGTRVPMFVTARRGITLDGSHPTLLAAEGAFGISMTPVFSPEVAAWLELGGIYAVANVRGGGEYGRSWHTAASGAKKPVAVDDLMSAADFLINQRYTQSSLLGVTGRGHGALIAAAAVSRRPELFGAALLDAGIYDMARFNRFTVGRSWVSEYGSPDRPNDLRTLLGYSPLHTMDAERSYPAMLITVGEHNDLATPLHSYKLAATVQAAQRGSAPILLSVDHDFGFSPGTPTSKLIISSADRLTFLWSALRPSK